MSAMQGGREHAEGRIGERVAPPRFRLAVEVSPARRFARQAKTVRASVVDLSITGARLFLVAPTTVVEPGRRYTVHHEAGSATVVVRHVETWSGGVQCGVQFADVDPGLQAEIDKAVAGDRIGEDWRWTVHR